MKPVKIGITRGFFTLGMIAAILWACNKDDENNGSERPLSSIVVTAPSDNITLDGSSNTLQLMARGLDQNGNTTTLSNVTWSSSDNSLATIDHTGLATFLEPGSVSFTATSGTVSGSKTITITFNAILSRIELSASNTVFVYGNAATVEVSAMAFDQRGNEMNDVAFTWSSSKPGVAEIDQEGVATLNSIGDARISVSADDIMGELTLSVRANPSFTTMIIANVNVVDVANGSIQANQDVVIEGDFIQSISPSGAPGNPANVNLVDGTDNFLMPGLCDAHVHVFFETDFIQYLANSVTSVVDMGNSAAPSPAESPALDWKNGVVAATLEAPNFYPSVMIRGPEDGGRIASNASEAVQLVRQWQDYDFIKAYSRVPEDAFDALLSEGANVGINVIGHANVNIGMSEVLARGQKMIAHAEEYLYSHFQGDNSQALIDDAITKTLNANAFVTGTLSTYEAISLAWGANQSGYSQLKARPGYEYTNQAYKNIWDGQFNGRYNQPGSLAGGLSFQKDYVKQFHDAGIKILLGTDSPLIIGLPAGFSIHEDIRILSEMNISNADILKIGTMNFAEFIKRDSRIDNTEDFGQVLPGYRADLVLLNENPLIDLETLRSPSMVMVRGKAYLKSYLDTELQGQVNGSLSGKSVNISRAKAICDHSKPY